MLEVPLGEFAVRIEASKIISVAEIFDDLTIALSANGKFIEGECPTCGSVHDEFVYSPPEEEFGPN